MASATFADTVTISNKQLWISRVLSGLAILFLAVDTGGKLLQIQPAVEGTAQLGFPAHALWTIAFCELLCLVTYLTPRSAVLGAILWTGYLGGAIATHVRMDAPLFSHTLFPVYVAALLWGGLYLREPRLRALLPLRD
ncbi:MAG TPA: DoxX family protein [Polyangiales bacterium]|nr:DoxX family protein [Polyangiales bacterium]